MKSNIPVEYFIFKIDILKKIFIIVLSISLISLLLGQKDFALGFLVGGVLASFIFSLLYKYVLQVRNFTLPNKKRFLILRSFALYAIMGFALFIGIKKGIYVFLGVALGLLTLKLALFTEYFKERHVSI